MVGITKSGQEAINTAKALRLEAYSELLDDWTEDELHIFSKLLSRLNRSIERRKRLQ
jgi:DNA-binding MarR family transcriptional regulator